MTAAFISRSDLSNLLGRDLSSDAGALQCVEAACEMCRDIADQEFNRGTTTDYFDGTGTDALLLPELPVNSIGTVAVSDGFTPPTWTTLGTADYSLDAKGILYATNTAGTALNGTCWTEGRQNVRITYDHGYQVDAAGTAVPQSIRSVALSIASRLLIQGPASFESLGDVTVRYAAESTAVMPTERMILRRYARD